MSFQVSSAFFRLLLLSSCVLLTIVARAQQAGDTVSVDCPAPRVVDLCVELDASCSVDPLSGSLTYRWNMGDGTTLTGPIVSHCYKERKRYTVQLDVVDDQTGEVRPAEKILPVDFTQETVLNFAAPDTVRVGQVITCYAADSQMPFCENVVVLWDFRDGHITNGRRVQHAFRRPGHYAIRMSLRGNGPDPCPDSHCVSRPIVIVQP